MNRRRFLSVVATTTTITLTGCTGSSNDTPEDTVEGYVNALYDGDYEAATSYVQGDLNGELTETYVNEQSALFEQGNGELNGFSTINKTDSEATVESVSSFDTNFGPMTTISRYELINSDDGWLIVSRETVDS